MCHVHTSKTMQVPGDCHSSPVALVPWRPDCNLLSSLSALVAGSGAQWKYRGNPCTLTSWPALCQRAVCGTGPWLSPGEQPRPERQSDSMQRLLSQMGKCCLWSAIGASQLCVTENIPCVTRGALSNEESVASETVLMIIIYNLIHTSLISKTAY